MCNCLLLLYAQLVVAMTAVTVIWSQCPTECNCNQNDAATSLAVDCQGRPDVDDGQLTVEIDRMLSNNLTYDYLVWLSIINSPLTNVPRSICRLTTLRKLHLGNNQIIRLPDNCFANLSNLIQFTASDNAIETLQDGVFDGLTRLEVLNLSRNRISAIGLSVFATSSKLTSLHYISLSENNLTSLEPWIYHRGIVGTVDRRIFIDLSHNRITKFTNKMGLRNICRGKVPYLLVYLNNNGIKYVMDMMNGWQFDITQLISCLKLTNGLLNINILYDHNMPCDCINYHFYRLFALQYKLYFDLGLKANCTVFDPVTNKSSIVNAFETDLSLYVCELTERCPAGCVCVHRPANATLHVYCSNRNLTVLPLELPELQDNRTKYKLDFSNNKLLRRLEHRDYFVNTSILDLSDCIVDEASKWQEIVKIPVVSLFGNSITSMPPLFRWINITNREMNLANNPWDCSCDNKWMSDFFSSIANRLTQKILCYSPPRLHGKNIIQISDEEFCVDPATKAASQAVKKTLKISMSSLASTVVVLLSVGVIVYRLRVKLYTKIKFHPFDRDECLGEDMDYDVFLSCSSDDNLPHGNRIRELLEQHGYRACYPPRDFVAGDTICDNIYNAVVRSKRTVCLLTEHFRQRFVPLFVIIVFCHVCLSVCLSVCMLATVHKKN